MEAHNATTEAQNVDKIEAALNERTRGDKDNVIIRFSNDGNKLNISVSETPLLVENVDIMCANQLGVDTEAIAAAFEQVIDGRRVPDARVGSVEVDPRHGIVVDASVHQHLVDDVESAVESIVRAAN